MNLFSPTKVTRAAPAPRIDDRAVQEAAADAARRRGRARGARSTNLSQFRQGGGSVLKTMLGA